MKFHSLVASTLIVMSTAAMSQSITLWTEEYKPFNYKEKGEVTGYSTDLVKEAFKRAGVDYKINITAWKRAYDTALKVPNNGVYSTGRTGERESLFKWSEALTEFKMAMLAKKKDGIKIASLDDAKKYKVGGYQGDVIAKTLQDKGFNLMLAKVDLQNRDRIDSGEIDIWPTGISDINTVSIKEGNEPLEVVHIIDKTPVNIAYNKETDQGIIDKVNAALKAMKSEGFYESAAKNYQK